MPAKAAAMSYSPSIDFCIMFQSDSAKSISLRSGDIWARQEGNNRYCAPYWEMPESPLAQTG